MTKQKDLDTLDPIFKRYVTKFEDIIISDRKDFKNVTFNVIGKNHLVTQLFEMLGFQLIENFKKADVVIFTGGSDVNPRFYGQEPIKYVTSVDKGRDQHEAWIYKSIIPSSQTTIGICRGAQLINVLNGGQLWQHVTNHGQYHHIMDINTGEIFPVTSTHHQQMIPNFKDWNFDIVAIACGLDGFKGTLSTQKYNEEESKIFKPSSKEMCLSDIWNPNLQQLVDYEVLWLEESQSLAFQPHPEYLDMTGGHETCLYFQSCLKESLFKAKPFQPIASKPNEQPAKLLLN